MLGDLGSGLVGSTRVDAFMHGANLGAGQLAGLRQVEQGPCAEGELDRLAGNAGAHREAAGTGRLDHEIETGEHGIGDFSPDCARFDAADCLDGEGAAGHAGTAPG